MAEEKKEEQEKIKVIEVSGSEFFENEMIVNTGEKYKIIVKPEKFTFSL